MQCCLFFFVSCISFFCLLFFWVLFISVILPHKWKNILLLGFAGGQTQPFQQRCLGARGIFIFILPLFRCVLQHSFYLVPFPISIWEENEFLSSHREQQDYRKSQALISITEEDCQPESLRSVSLISCLKGWAEIIASEEMRFNWCLSLVFHGRSPSSYWFHLQRLLFGIHSGPAGHDVSKLKQLSS